MRRYRHDYHVPHAFALAGHRTSGGRASGGLHSARTRAHSDTDVSADTDPNSPPHPHFDANTDSHAHSNTATRTRAYANADSDPNPNAHHDYDAAARSEQYPGRGPPNRDPLGRSRRLGIEHVR